MKQTTELALDPSEQQALAAGRVITFTLGEHTVAVRFYVPTAALHTLNGPRPTRSSSRRATTKGVGRGKYGCPKCPRNFRNGTGLAAHLRGKTHNGAPYSRRAAK